MQRKHLIRRTKGDRIYVYFRSPSDGTLTPLPNDEGSAEFARCYDACIKSIAADHGRRASPRRRRSPLNARVGFLEGTIGRAIARYMASSEFAILKPSTQSNIRRRADRMRDRLGPALLADLDTDAIDIYTEELTQEVGASVADAHVDLIAKIWKVCKKYPEFKLRGKVNPTIEAERRYEVKRPHQPWPPDVQALFMQTAPDHLQLAKLVLHFSAQRGGDCIKIKWDDFDGKGIWVRPEKTDRNHDPLPNYHLCPKPLLDALNAAPRVAETILVTSRGRPYSRASCLAMAIRRHLKAIGVYDKQRLSMHGLRKNAASEVGALLVGTAGIRSVTGHRSNSMADFYAQHASQVAMNAAVVEKWDAALAAGDPRVRERRSKIKQVK